MFVRNYKLWIVVFFILFTSYKTIAEDNIEHKIAVLVNDDVITSYDIFQRLKLTAALKGINLNTQNSQPMINNVVDELIREKIKLSEVDKYQVKIEKHNVQDISFYILLFQK